MNGKQPQSVLSRREYKPEIIIFPTAEEVDAHVAEQIISQIQVKSNSVFTFPTGSTPEGMYKLLVEAHKTSHISFRNIVIFNLDEYWPIRRGHPSSYYWYMKHHFINHIDVQLTNWHIADGEASDPSEEAEKFEKLLLQNDVDVAILGVGPGTTCHIGFNEKGSAVDSRTRYNTLDRQTRIANAKYFSNPDEIPQGAITQGVADILRAKRIFLIAKGESKAWGINRIINGAVGPDAPASFLRYHHAVTFILDKEAANLLH